MNIGENIKSLRKNKHLTQQDFANSIGISRNALINYETNKRTPSLELLIKIGNTFKINIFDLVEPENPIFSDKFYKQVYFDLRDTNSIKKVLELVFIHNEYLNNKFEAAAPSNTEKAEIINKITDYISMVLSDSELLNMPFISGDDDGEL